MGDIVGTITNVKNFLSTAEVKLSVKPNTPQAQTITLSANRKFSIPGFQRELRWEEHNTKMLLSDLSRGTKFLGNVILTIKGDHTCEIIDGQQRTTILLLIIFCIKKKYGTQITIPETCPLLNESFTDFQKLLDVYFDSSAMSEQEWNDAMESDKYSQYPRIQKLWNTISESELLSDRHKAQSLLDNLCGSDVNIIANYSENINISIQYFLDVNLKGVRLDTEDIFKGYLFSQDDRNETKNLWQRNKSCSLRLNAVSQGTDEKKYPLMKMYEHFFYCDLYLPRGGVCEYTALRFGENFGLTAEFKSGDTKFYEGSHLIEAIRDRDYLQKSLTRLNACMSIMIDIVESDTPSAAFKRLFVCPQTVDFVDVCNCHTMLKKILMEKEVIPKILAMKYILSYFDGASHEKKEYKSAYSVFCASVLFSIFANKKESETFYNIVRLPNWAERIDHWLFDYTSSHALTRGKMLAAYKYCEEEEDINQVIRCKSLAAICSFFKVTKNGGHYALKISNAEELKEFFNNSSSYSVEHFAIGEKGTLHIQTTKYDIDYTYPTPIKRYRNSLFNYMFIPRGLNSDLSNKPIFEKVAEITPRIGEVTCKYSLKYYRLLNAEPKGFFKKYPSSTEIDAQESEEAVKELLDAYFCNVFPDEFLDFAIALIQQTKWSN